jgi:hypothetical protein
MKQGDLGLDSLVKLDGETDWTTLGQWIESGSVEAIAAITPPAQPDIPEWQTLVKNPKVIAHVAVAFLLASFVITSEHLPSSELRFIESSFTLRFIESTIASVLYNPAIAFLFNYRLKRKGKTAIPYRLLCPGIVATDFVGAAWACGSALGSFMFNLPGIISVPLILSLALGCKMHLLTIITNNDPLRSPLTFSEALAVHGKSLCEIEAWV